MVAMSQNHHWLATYISGEFLCNLPEIKDPRKNVFMKSKNGQVSLYNLLISPARGCIWKHQYPIQLRKSLTGKLKHALTVP